MRVRILLEFLQLMPFPSLEYVGNSFSITFCILYCLAMVTKSGQESREALLRL